MPTDFYQDRENQKILVVNAIISRLNLFKTHFKHSFYPYLNRLMLLIQQPIVLSVVKEEIQNKKSNLQLGYTSAADPEIRPYFTSCFIKDLDQISHKTREELINEKFLIPIWTDSLPKENFYIALSKITYAYPQNDKKIPIKNFEFDHYDQIFSDVHGVLEMLYNYAQASKCSDKYRDFISDSLENLVNNFNTEHRPKCPSIPEDELEKVKNNVKSKKQALIQNLRQALDNVYSECEDSPLISRRNIEDKFSISNIFCVIRTIKLDGLRRNKYNYTPQIVFSNKQIEQITKLIKKTKEFECKIKAQCSIYPNCPFPEGKNKHEFETNIKEFIAKIEEPLGTKARFISDHTMASGILELCEGIIGVGRNDPGNSAEDLNRQEHEVCFLNRIALRGDLYPNIDSSDSLEWKAPRLWQIPVRVHGITWMTLSVPLLGNEKQWSRTFQIYIEIYTKLIRNIRRQMITLYLKEVEEIFSEHILNDVKIDKTTLLSINKDWEILQCIFPFPIFELELVSSINDQEKIKFGNAIKNPYFSCQIDDYDTFNEKLISKIKELYNQVVLKSQKEIYEKAFTESIYQDVAPSNYQYSFKNDFKKYEDGGYDKKNNLQLILIKGRDDKCELLVREFIYYFEYPSTYPCNLIVLDNQYSNIEIININQNNDSVVKDFENTETKSDYLYKFKNIHFKNYKEHESAFIKKYQNRFIEIIKQKRLIIISGEDVNTDLVPKKLHSTADIHMFVLVEENFH